jgi:hypothetical protein
LSQQFDHDVAFGLAPFVLYSSAQHVDPAPRLDRFSNRRYPGRRRADHAVRVRHGAPSCLDGAAHIRTGEEIHPNPTDAAWPAHIGGIHMEKLDRRDSNADPFENEGLEGNIVEMVILRTAAALQLAGDARRWNVKRRGGALFDKIEFDRSRSVRCPIRISVRRGEYPPRFRSTRCMMFARCRARRASTSLYPIASYGEISVCIPLSLLQMGRVCYSERVQITFRGKTGASRMSLNLLRAQIARCFATECAEGRSRVGLEL